MLTSIAKRVGLKECTGTLDGHSAPCSSLRLPMHHPLAGQGEARHTSPP